eukprot:6214279-Pleurochrysis_carterae.AAC.1
MTSTTCSCPCEVLTAPLSFFQARQIISQFWGRTHWARDKLREAVRRNHGQELGLQKAHETMLAGRFRKLAHLLRLQLHERPQRGGICCLQEPGFNYPLAYDGQDGVDYYKDELYPTQGHSCDEFDDAIQDARLNDDFWRDVQYTLQVVTALLRLLWDINGDHPCMGKVYQRMHLARHAISNCQAAWKDHAADIQSKNCAKLHSSFHLQQGMLRYALAPAFRSAEVLVDEEGIQAGLRVMIQRLSLLDVVQEAPDTAVCLRTIKLSDVEVYRRAEAAMQECKLYRRPQSCSQCEAKLQSVATELTPTGWWQKYGIRFPAIDRAAQRVLSQPVSASVSPRSWSQQQHLKVKAHRSTCLAADEQDAFGHQPVYCYEPIRLAGQPYMLPSYAHCVANRVLGVMMLIKADDDHANDASGFQHL